MTDESRPSAAELYRETATFLEACGARPAGSPAEAAALDWVQARMETLGYACQRQPFRFARLSRRLLRNLLGGAVVIAAAALLPRFPYLALALPLWLAVLPHLQAGIQARLPGRLTSHNLLCLPGGEAGKIDLLLTAHVDTARALPNRQGVLAGLRAEWYGILRRVGWIAAVCAAPLALGLNVPPVLPAAVLLLAGVSVLILLAVDLADAFGAGGVHTRGANDNASGVIVLLALAQRLAGLPDLRAGWLSVQRRGGSWAGRRAQRGALAASARRAAARGQRGYGRRGRAAEHLPGGERVGRAAHRPAAQRRAATG